MATAKFFDNYSSTLSGSYTSGGTSLSVTGAGSGASALPATAGDYYLTVDAGDPTEEVFKVTGRSSLTLTVVGAQAGTSAANHASGAIIKGPILTADGIAQLKADIASGELLTAVAFDALGGTYPDGYTVRLSDTAYEAVSYSGAWSYFHRSERMTRPPTTGWTQVNPGAAVFDLTNIALSITSPTGSGNNLRVLSRTLPSTPYTIICKVGGLLSANGFPLYGIGLRDSSGGKLVIMGMKASGGLWLDKYTAPGTFSAGYTSNALVNSAGNELWMQVSDDGTTRTWSVGADEQHLSVVTTNGHTDFLTADSFVFVGETNGGSFASQASMYSYREF